MFLSVRDRHLKKSKKSQSLRGENIMSRVWYGSLNNRIEENRQFVEEIKVGTGVTEYFYSDRHAYEVVEVKDQKHISIREYDHKHVGDTAMDNNWELISNENNPVIELVKRGKYWYSVATITPEEAKEIYEGDNIDWKLWACNHNFDLQEIIASGKTKKSYTRKNISIGVARYYYDYEF